MFCSDISVCYAVYAEWEKSKPLQMYYGYAATVEINSETKAQRKNRAVKIWISLMRLGAITGCHQMNERSLFFRGYQFPVCARCTGLFIGQVAGIPFFLLFLNFNFTLLLICTIVSVILLGIDGFFQLKGIWVSTNFRRMGTGILCGFFVTGLFVTIIKLLYQTVT